MEDTEKMSVSKTVAILRAKEEANVAAAQAQLNLVDKVLSGIPGNSPEPVGVSKHGYCAQATLEFKGSGLAQTLFELYPPMECVDVSGSTQTQKPAKYLRDEDRYSAIVPIFPVVFKTSGTETHARWWTTMNGLDVAIEVAEAKPGEFDVLQSGDYLADQHCYSSGSVTFYPRPLATPIVRPGTAEDFDTVRDWFKVLFAKHSHLYENDYASKRYITHQLRKDTGLDVAIRIMRQNGRKVGVSCWFPGLEVYPDYAFDLSDDPMAPRVKPQDLDVQYL